MIKFDGVTIIGWIFLQKATSPELSQASIFDSQVEGADDQLCVLLILRPGLLSSPRTATVGRRLSFRLGRCQGHRGKGCHPWVGWLAVAKSRVAFCSLCKRIGCPPSSPILVIFPWSHMEETSQNHCLASDEAMRRNFFSFCCSSRIANAVPVTLYSRLSHNYYWDCCSQFLTNFWGFFKFSKKLDLWIFLGFPGSKNML